MLLSDPQRQKKESVETLLICDLFSLYKFVIYFKRKYNYPALKEKR